MTVIKETLEWVDIETNQFDTRCRADIDTGNGFTRLGDGRVAQVLLGGTGKIRIYTSKFRGPAETAEKLEADLISANTTAGMTRLSLVQS
jgi:hypothetical protein